MELYCVGFWDKNIGYFFLENQLKKYKFINGEKEQNKLNNKIIIVGNFINKNQYDFIINNKNNYYVGYVTEPVEHTRPFFFNLVKLNIFCNIFGSVVQLGNSIKYPLYFNIFDHSNKNIFVKINDIIKNVNKNDIINKNFCTMICGHDNGKTRYKIYNELVKIKNIDCPGKLFNNMSNKELNEIGNDNFISKYLFNICPNNYKCDFNGYIVEKPFLCCLGGAIPIYYGYIDNIDFTIFNKKRFIFYDAFDDNSINKCIIFINELINDIDKLCEFYKQPIFVDCAYENALNMKNNVYEMFDNLIYQINNKSN